MTHDEPTMIMESVYLETTFISYLVALPSRDLIVAAHQQATQDWWTHRRTAFDCFVSQLVIDEASVGDPLEVQKRLAVIENMSVLSVSEEAEGLTQQIMASRALPAGAIHDAAHIAIATMHRIDFLLTWNCKHLANAQIMRKIEEVCKRLGYRMPVICTPEELMGT